MNITLKNVKHAAFASDETQCFEATIYVDGKKAGSASNDGNGGQTYIFPLSLEVQLDAYSKTLGLEDYLESGDYVIDTLVDDWLTSRDLKRAMSNKLLFTKTGRDGVYETNKATKDFIERARKDRSLISKIEHETVLNFLPFSEALEIYKAAS